MKWLDSAPVPDVPATIALSPGVTRLIEEELGNLTTIYKELHAAPELSHREENTSAFLAAELRRAGYSVTERVGRYPEGTQAYGVVGILKNGIGPTLLIRAEMDALPVTEDTGLPYASKVRSITPTGENVGVMHACGHDIHLTCLIGVARIMAKLRSQWRGTLMLICQPSEETIDGAKAMLADGLYERFGTPDFAIALHDYPFPAGDVAVVSGSALSSSTSIDVIMRGTSSHGSAPEKGKDPIVMAAEFIVQVQTIVSRCVPPQQAAVVTVGQIHGGTKRNIIPDEVRLELTTRSYNPAVRQIIIEGVRRTASGVALAAGVPQNRMPIVNVLDNESSPVTNNDPALAARLQHLFTQRFGADHIHDMSPLMVSEDFGVYGMDGKIPYVIFWLGMEDAKVFIDAREKSIELPSLHSSRFAPAPELTLKTGITALCDAALDLLK